MLPPYLMLTTKFRAQFLLIFLLGLTVISGGMGCAPSGTRALLKGEELVEQGKYAEAVKHFEKATEEFPDNAKAWNHLGLGYQYAGETKKAVEAYQQALTLDRNLTVARYNLGSLHLDQNNFPAAVMELTTFIQLEPKSADGWHKLGVAQMRTASQVSGAEKNRQLDNAKKSLEYSQHLVPSAETLNILGMLQIQRGRAADAVPIFTAALQQDPEYAPALLNLAVVYHQYLGDKRKALANYQQFLNAAKQAPEVAQVQATVRQLENELNSTVANVAPSPVPAPVVPRAVVPTDVSPARTEPKSPEVVVAKPPVQKPAPTLSSPKAQPVPKKEPRVEVATLPDEPPPVKTGQDVPVTTVKPNPSATVTSPIPPRVIDTPRKESGTFTKLNPVTWFKKKPKETTPVTVLPSAKPTMENSGPRVVETPQKSAPTVVRPVIPRYKYRSPAKPREGNRIEAHAFFTRGVQAQKDQRVADALSAYRQAIQKDPSYFEATYNLALAARAAGDLSAALTAYEQALVIMPESVNARYNFAFTLQEAGYFQDAANELERLLRQNPNETRAHLLLASLCAQRLNQISTAREHYQKVLEQEPQHPQATQIRYWLAGHP